jgi:hypothetical protein
MSDQPLVRVRVPEQHYAGFMALLSLEPGQSEELISAIESTPPTLPIEDFAAKVSSKTSLAPKTIEDVVTVLVSLYALRRELSLTVGDFLNVIVDALDSSRPTALRPSDGNWEPFRATLDKLLSLGPTLGILAKAAQLRTYEERIFHDARIITDIRPVFEADPEQLPVGGLIIHTLQITYHHEGSLKELHLAIDPEGVDKLRGLLNRADLKAKTLSSVLEKASLIVLEEQSNE